MSSIPARSGAVALRRVAAQLLTLVLAAGIRPAAAQTDFPNIPIWSYPGAWHPGVGGDTITARPRTISLRWLRDPVAEARPDFGGYRIYRATNFGDTTTMVLVRRFSKQIGDSLFIWHFPAIDGSTPESQRVATFIDPDSSGRFIKVCRLRRPQSDPNGACLSRGDSVLMLVPPPGPHDGFRTWYSITYEARNTTDNDYLDQFVPGSFGDRREFPGGFGPRSILLLDANRDGVRDLAVANAGADVVSLFLGTGDGSFKAPAAYAVGSKPSGLAVGDFDRDGLSDVAVANRGSNDVSVLFGDGAGSFGRRADFGVGLGPVALGAADVNRDAKADLVIASSLEVSCSVLLGQGDGTFQRGSDLVGATAGPTDVLVNELNGDGDPDLVVGTYQGAEVWRGNGDGTFALFFGLAGSSGAHSVALAELDTGRVDIVYGNAADGDLRIGAGLRDGTYTIRSVGAVGTGITAVETADLDADGEPEVVVANPAEGRLAVVYLDSALNPRRQVNLAIAGAPRAVKVGNLDSEGMPDLVVADSSLGVLSVIPGSKNLNHKAANVSNDVWEPREASAEPDSHFFSRAIEPTGGPTANLARVGVVPNPYRAAEAWNPSGGHEVHFVNLPPGGPTLGLIYSNPVVIRIYTVAGDLVKTIELDSYDSGRGVNVNDFARWDLKNDAGRDVSSGIYMYRVEAKGFFYQSRFVVIR